VVAPCVKALSEGEEMFRPVISNQGFGDCFFTSLDAVIAQACQLAWVSLSIQNALKNCDPADSRDVADDVV